MGSQLVSTLPTCYGEVTSHAPGQDGHNRVLPVPTVGQTVNASAEVGAWHTLAPPKRGSPATLRLAHSVPVPCGTNLGLSPFGFRVNSSAPSRNGTGWICTNLVMYLQFTRPPRFLAWISPEKCNGQQDDAVGKTAKSLLRGLFSSGNCPTIALSGAWVAARCR